MIEAIELDTNLVEIGEKNISKRNTLKDVLYVSKMKKHLLLMDKLVIYGCKVQFDMNGCFVRTMEKKEVSKDTKNDKLYIINSKKINGVDIAAFVNFQSNEDKMGIWLQRL